MGCITSKAIARSMSIREEYFAGSFHSRAVALEALSTSQHMNDNSKTSSPSKDPETVLESELFTITWDFGKDSEDVADAQNLNFSKLTRSKSCQIPVETEKTLDSTDKNVTGSRSFHTVEEYDALLARIHKGNEKSNESFEDYLSSLNVKKLEELKSLDEDQDIIDIQRDDSLKDTEKSVRETGWKRKSIAKGLKSLDVCTVEFPAVARVRQWVHVEGQVFSPGTYMTPKFGSYNSKVKSKVQEDGEDGSVFSPELIAAFEEYMKQLQVDEEGILSQIDDGDSEVDETMN